MNKKVLVTGSCGFIFSNFIRKSIYEKFPYSFCSIDNASKGTALNNIYTNKSHPFYIGDVCDLHFLNVIFEIERPDIVIHAAETSVNDSNKLIQTNILGTQNIIDACIKWNINTLLYVSTEQVYGSYKENNYFGDGFGFNESHPINSNNYYASSKASGELLIKSASNSNGLNYIITRPSNTYGQRQTSEKLIPKIIKCINNNEKIPVHGKGEQVRSWTHVFDNCSAILKILDKTQFNGKGQGEIYNISSNQEFTTLEVVQEVCNAMGKGHDLISFIPPKPGYDFMRLTDSSKLRSLGWKPSFKFKSGISQTVEWFKNNSWSLR